MLKGQQAGNREHRLRGNHLAYATDRNSSQSLQNGHFASGSDRGLERNLRNSILYDAKQHTADRSGGANEGEPAGSSVRGDGKVLYALNAGRTISVFSMASDLSLQLIQDAVLPLAAGQLSGNVVCMRLSASGNKIAATTLDGWLYAGDVSSTDGTISGIAEIQAAQNANLEEVVLDPTGQSVYISDQDNGGIYEFSATGGQPVLHKHRCARGLVRG
jgi:DNA-binding beta-propeller fold protein YncE